MDKLVEMLAKQVEQEVEIHGSLPVNREEQRALAEKFGAKLVGELYEYLDSIGVRSFFSRDEAPRSARMLELVDILKYWLCLCWTEGASAEELMEYFLAKTRLVTSKYRQRVLTSRIAGFDLDGTLCEYGDWGPSEEAFVESGGVLSLQLLPGAAELLNWLKENGWDVVIVTARKAHILRRLEIDTLDWIHANNLPVDRVLFGYDKMSHIKPYGGQFRFFVDDSPKHCLDVAMSGINTYQMVPPGVRPVEHPYITPATSLYHLRGLLERVVKSELVEVKLR